jgi:hypothetical protein
MSGNRTLLMIVGGIAIVIVAFVVTTYILNWSSPSNDQSASGIAVQTATYGGSCNAKPGNATAYVQGTCGGKASCSFTVDLTKLGGDPAPGCGKTFSVEYSCGGGSAAKIANLPAEANGSVVQLSCP